MTIPSKLVAFSRSHGNKCYWCKGIVLLNVYANHGLAPSRDHLKPKSEGGTSHPNNLVLAHRSCNSRRGSLSEETFTKMVDKAISQEVYNDREKASLASIAPTKKQWVSMRDFWPTKDNEDSKQHE